MGLGSIILGIFAFLLMISGVIFVWVPFLGTMLSFLSPILAIAGVILGGVAMSRAKQGMGENEGLATAGLVLNIIAFVPAMLVALTCGLCNTMCTGAFLNPQEPTHQTVPWDRDGGPGSNPFEDLFDPPDAAVDDPVAPLPDPNAPPVPMQRQGDETPLPPPPLPPGPAGGARPAPTEAAPTGSAPAGPAPTEPAPAEAAPTEAAPTEAPTGVTTDPPADPAPETTRTRRRRASH